MLPLNRGDPDPPPINKNKYVTLGLHEYMELLADLNMLKAFANTMYKFRQQMTPEKIEEHYETCKGAI